MRKYLRADYALLILPAFFIITLVLPSFSSAQCSLPPPPGAVVTNITPCSVTVKWKKQQGAKKYLIKYRTTTGGWQGNIKIKDTTYVFSGLLSAAKYTFTIQGVCQNGYAGAANSVRAMTAACSLPLSVVKDSVGIGEEKIAVTTDCSFDTLYCYYGTQINSLTSFAYSIATSITLNNLQTNTTYYFKVSTCPLAKNNFTPADSFRLTPISVRPNIILIVLDDARYDYYSCNGAPSFMHTPSIDRIANEGINFKNSFVVNSECAPGRATIATGTYTCRNYVYDNVHPFLLNPDLPLLPEILHNNGYYTALVGKNHDIYTYGNGYFDYWLEYISSAQNEHDQFNYMGNDVTLVGYDTNIITDSALKVIDRASQPYFMQLAYHAPHDPINPDQQYQHTFDNDTVPLGPDTAQYTVNYPSFLYNLSGGALASPAEAENSWKGILEMILSVEDGMDSLLNKLQAKGELDNTMIIFTSDNGHLLGEHYLDAKRFAYEPSMRVPLFIRYPAWFPAGSIDTSNMALNVDYAPTIIQAAGIPDTFGMDGRSLKDFYDGTDSRTTMYYHYFYSTEGTWVKLPTIHAVRDNHYAFIHYGCSAGTTEEFFDLYSDPDEMNNLINTSSMSATINTYRTMLNDMELQYLDTASETQLNCNLANPVYNRNETVMPDLHLIVYPNPASGFFFIENYSDDEVLITVSNELGQMINKVKIPGQSYVRINVPSAGIYFLNETGYNRVMKLITQ